jgi:hypothetical protein
VAKTNVLTDAEYVAIGRRRGSEDIAEEAARASARWSRDLPVLAAYGRGQALLAEFEALRAEHGALLVARPEMIAAKRGVVRERAEQVALARHWVGRASSLLETLGHQDAALAERFNAAAPADDSALVAGIGALTRLLQEVASSLPEDANVPELVEEAPALMAALSNVAGAVSTAKSATVADTLEADRLDGKLYVTMRELNRAARRAIRAGKLKADPSNYRFERGSARNKSAPTPRADA